MAHNNNRKWKKWGEGNESFWVLLNSSLVWALGWKTREVGKSRHWLEILKILHLSWLSHQTKLWSKYYWLRRWYIFRVIKWYLIFNVKIQCEDTSVCMYMHNIYTMDKMNPDQLNYGDRWNMQRVALTQKKETNETMYSCLIGTSFEQPFCLKNGGCVPVSLAWVGCLHSVNTSIL